MCKTVLRHSDFDFIQAVENKRFQGFLEDGWTDRQTDGQMDGQTDGWMDKLSYRDARTYLEMCSLQATPYAETEKMRSIPK